MKSAEWNPGHTVVSGSDAGGSRSGEYCGELIVH